MRTITKKHRLEDTYLTKTVNTQIKKLRTVFSSTTIRRDKTNCKNLLIQMFSLAVSDRPITIQHTNRRNRKGEQPCCNTLPQYLVDRQRRRKSRTQTCSQKACTHTQPEVKKQCSLAEDILHIIQQWWWSALYIRQQPSPPPHQQSAGGTGKSTTLLSLSVFFTGFLL